jgi:hypothetical protein
MGKEVYLCSPNFLEAGVEGIGSEIEGKERKLSEAG